MYSIFHAWQAVVELEAFTCTCIMSCVVLHVDVYSHVRHVLMYAL